MILADTSAWIEFERATGSAVDVRMTELLQQGQGLAITEPIVMELLSARRPGAEIAKVRSRLLGFRMLPVGGLQTWEHAAVIQRACRARGETVRSMIDCLVAAVAIREGAKLIQHDRDFELIARHAPLELEQV